MSNGSEARVPHVYQQAVFKMTEAVTCTKCKHQHLLEPPSLEIQHRTLQINYLKRKAANLGFQIIEAPAV
jgi:hypothetical protein